MTTIYLAHYEPCARNQIHKTEHELGLKLLSKGLAGLYDLDIPADALPQHLAFTEYQKPYLKDYPGLYFNISHCDLLVACAFGDSPIGIDIERLRPFRETIFRKMLTAEEQTFLLSLKHDPKKYEEYFYRFWTLKESRIKQSGLGFAMPLTEFSFSFDCSGATPRIVCSAKGLHFYQQLLDPDYILSVCCDAPITGLRLIG